MCVHSSRTTCNGVLSGQVAAILLVLAGASAPGDPDQHPVGADVAPVPGEPRLAVAGAGLAVARRRHGALRVAVALFAAEARVRPEVGRANIALLPGNSPGGLNSWFYPKSVKDCLHFIFCERERRLTNLGQPEQSPPSHCSLASLQTRDSTTFRGRKLAYCCRAQLSSSR